MDTRTIEMVSNAQNTDSYITVIDEVLNKINNKEEKDWRSQVSEILKLIADFLDIKRLLLFYIDTEKESFDIRMFSSSDLKIAKDKDDFARLGNQFPMIAGMFMRYDEVEPQSVDELLREYPKEKEILKNEGVSSFWMFKEQYDNLVYGAAAFKACEDFGDSTFIARIKTLLRIVIREIKQKLSANELHLANKAWQSINENSYNVETWILPEGKIKYLSKSCFDVFGYTQKEFYNDPVLYKKLIYEEDLELVEKAMKEMWKMNATHGLEFRINSKDNKLKWVKAFSRQVYDLDKEFEGIRLSLVDITEFKRLEQELLVAKENLELFNQDLCRENIILKEKRGNDEDKIFGIVTRNQSMLNILSKIRQVAATNSPVLILGETGTGKELIANAIHVLSQRNKKPMVTVNCASIPEALVESELFGREKGAYTGALSRQIGRFEVASQSSIFLDEIGELPYEIQAKLLRVIQFGEFQMLGSPKTYNTDVRIIAATNRNLNQAIQQGTFREDLFYRLNVFPIHIPPLRERKEDIPLLVWEFVKEFNREMGKRITQISKSNMNKLTDYNWPGNLRELRNVIEYSMIISDSYNLNVELHENTNRNESGYGQLITLEEVERNHIVKILEMVDWKIRGEDGAAEMLGLNESTLRFRMKKLNIKR